MINIEAKHDPKFIEFLYKLIDAIEEDILIEINNLQSTIYIDNNYTLFDYIYSNFQITIPKILYFKHKLRACKSVKNNINIVDGINTLLYMILYSDYGENSFSKYTDLFTETKEDAVKSLLQEINEALYHHSEWKHYHFILID